IQRLAEKAWVRHPLAFLVEAADDICYNIIDLEDACTLGLIPLDENVQLIAAILGEKFSYQKLNSLNTRAQKLAILRALAINQLIQETVAAFQEQEQKML